MFLNKLLFISSKEMRLREELLEILGKENKELVEILSNYPKGLLKIIEEEKEEEEKVELPFSGTIKEIFLSKGIEKLYKFQSQAIEEIDKGKNVVISSPTASGKTEVFLYKAIKSALQGKHSLLIYPTKALSRDQLKRFSYLRFYGIEFAVYDGDTSPSARKKIREKPPHLLLTNFDMLHHILLNYKKFNKFFEKLENVVIDEVHVYNGVFGSHVGNVIRRLKRIMKKAFSKKLQFLVTSATIKNAKAFSSSLVGEEFVEIKGLGRKKKIIHIILSSDLESYLTTTLKLISTKKKMLVFVNSHSSAERLFLLAKRKGIEALMYRAGLEKEERRKIERAFKISQIPLITTSALELGIDIGDVNIVVLAGFPGNISSSKQRIGRAGRRGKGIAIFIARQSPLDSYYFDHPEEYIFGESEECYANKNNPYILKPHLLAMAKEMLIEEKEVEELKAREVVEELVEKGFLSKFGRFYATTREGFKEVAKLSLRSSGKVVEIYEGEKKIGERELYMAIKELFENAIYLHGGKVYISKGLDLKNMKAYVERFDSYEYYTKALSDETAEILEEYKAKAFPYFSLHLGKVKITTSVYGFLIKDIFSNSTLGEQRFEEDYRYERISNALWIDFNEKGMERIEKEVENFGDGLHAFEHVAISLSPLLTLTSPTELGGISYPNGRMFIYEGIEGGIGLVDILFERFDELCLYSWKRLNECECENGCPKCILDPMCGNDNKYLSKKDGKEIAFFLSKAFKKL